MIGEDIERECLSALQYVEEEYQMGKVLSSSISVCSKLSGFKILFVNRAIRHLRNSNAICCCSFSSGKKRLITDEFPQHSEGNVANDDDETKGDAYDVVLKPPTFPNEKFTRFDGGVDLEKQGFTAGKKCRFSKRSEGEDNNHGTRESVLLRDDKFLNKVSSVNGVWFLWRKR